MPRYTAALLAEMNALLPAPVPVETIFIGGGTPSILPPELLSRLLAHIRQHSLLNSAVEITSEANPGTLTREWLDAAVSGGVNRISMGMQAYQPELLRTLGRIHTYQDVQQSVRVVRRAGIQNLNLDLMFGLPGQTPEMWRETLDSALTLEPEHLSCYGLIPEEGTPLKSDLDTGTLTLPDEDDERRMYDDTLEILSKAGFRQYEISNFARPGFECRHNLGYWRRVPYLGFGASAASFCMTENGAVRRTNPADIPTYLRMIETAEWDMRETLPITEKDARFEELMLGFRVTQGVNSQSFYTKYGIRLEDYMDGRILKLYDEGLLEFSDGFWRLTRRGMDVQNAVLVELMED